MVLYCTALPNDRVVPLTDDSHVCPAQQECIEVYGVRTIDDGNIEQDVYVRIERCGRSEGNAVTADSRSNRISGLHGLSASTSVK